MGQKVHPFGFRLGITKQHKSFWCTDFKEYAKILQIEDKFREKLSSILKTFSKKQKVRKQKKKDKKQQKEILVDWADINIELNQFKKELYFEIKTQNPKILILRLKKTKNFLDFLESLKTELPELTIFIKFRKLNYPNLLASILAQSLSKKLERRTTFRRAIKSTISEFKIDANRLSLDPKEIGIKIQISGRLNGAEIARIEWKREGRVPLHTLKSKIFYSFETAQTASGTLGIKIWSCIG